MRAHDDHGIYHHHQYRFPRQEVRQENNKYRQHAGGHQPTDKGNPVFLVFENINPGEGFAKELPDSWLYQKSLCMFPAIGGYLENLVDKNP